jgi:hypothetical protein
VENLVKEEICGSRIMCFFDARICTLLPEIWKGGTPRDDMPGMHESGTVYGSSESGPIRQTV